ncbi:hypothetical protein TD95_005232 [Thielaviopsis punctulata]|uniref:AAA+ ATPase domain-containing protein n=1 Tax=Thielaviopsis punctulata TaxID=72032 RepID=A0A0F4Z6R1_9PEZI|nr:hypothetical protein TD95_005232 [Thielaviopsis punctulata]
MSRLLTRTSQMARLVRSTPALVISRGLVASSPRIPTRTLLPTVSLIRARARLYSTTPPSQPPPEPENNNDPDPENNSNKSDNKKLPPGWIYFSDKDLDLLIKFSETATGFQKDIINTVLRDIRQFGAPAELRDLLTRAGGQKLALADVAKMMRLMHVMAQEYAMRHTEIERQKMEEDIRNREDNQMFRDDEADNQRDSQRGFFGQQNTQKDKENNDKQQKDKKDDGKPRTYMFSLNMNDIFLTIVTFMVIAPFLQGMFTSTEREITWQELRRMFLDKGLVEKLTVRERRVDVQLNHDAVRSIYGDSGSINANTGYFFSIGSVDSFEKHLEQAQDELQIPPSQRIPVSYGSSKSTLMNLVIAFGPTLLLVGLMFWTTKQISSRGGNQMFGFGKSRAKKFNHETAVKVKFADVAGMDEAKVEIMEFVQFLKKPEKFVRLGAKIPRGAILSGPPGTGKTLLAKATAGESGVPFFSVSGSEFVEMFVGVGPSRVRDLFATARKNAPCIIFIDEIDAIGRSRTDSNRMGGGNDERESTLNQILTEMDGFNTAEQIVVLAGTNRADILDKALMRPGRFDRHIYIDRPTMKGREDIFKVHLKKIVTREDIDYLTGRLATLTPGFSGADIANVVNEAALVAARANAESVVLMHFEKAIERVIGGLERKSLVLNPVEKRTVAYHEAGHAICGWYFKDADPLLKVSIIPRGQGALGYAQYLPQDAYLMSVEQLMDRMAMTLGGRISEEMHFPTVTTGASDDFKKVTQMAQRMVTEWGMSDKVGPLHYENNPNQFQKPFAEATAQQIDAEVHRIIDDAYRRCRDLLTSKKREIGLVAEELLAKEVLTRDDMVRLLGPRPFEEKGDFEKYFGGDNPGLGKENEPDARVEDEKSDGPIGGVQPSAMFKAPE